jgi:hypothetical protein
MATVADYVIGDLLFLFPGQLDGYIVTPGVQHAFLVLRERHRNMAMRRGVNSSDKIHGDNPLNNLFSCWFNYRYAHKASKRSVPAAGGRQGVGGVLGSLAVRGGCF